MSDHRHTILAIDDDNSLLRTFEMFFQPEGILIVGAHGGEEGFKRAQQIYPEMILLDILMPGMDGKQVLRLLKADDKLKDVPVIVFSNVLEDHEKQEVLSLGAHNYFVKTEIEPEVLLHHVQALLKH